MSEYDVDNAPVDLGVRGKRFWRETLTKFDLRNDELVLLVSACRQLDDCARLEAALRGAPTLVFNRLGAPVPNPIFQRLHTARQIAARLILQLKLDDAAGESDSRSNAGRALVSQRRDRKAPASPRFEVV